MYNIKCRMLKWKSESSILNCTCLCLISTHPGPVDECFSHPVYVLLEWCEKLE